MAGCFLTGKGQHMIALLPQSLRPMLAGLIVIIGLGVGALAATGRGPIWDGTWAGGWETGGDGVQITFVGQKLISFYRGDYRDTGTAQVSADGKVVTFTFSGGDVRLERTGEDDARITLRERGRPERAFTVKRE
jgi:hypothetical protein